jgi:hypothetical protein
MKTMEKERKRLPRREIRTRRNMGRRWVNEENFKAE